MKLIILLITVSLLVSLSSFGQNRKTYCNPVNIDYGYTPIPDYTEAGRHRATTDPVIVNYKGDYYLFSTNQWGYWWSSNMLKWNYISKRFLRPWNNSFDELCAPAVGIIGDTMLVFGSTYTRTFSIWMSTDPKNNIWKPLVDSFDIGGWDPAFFTDDNGKFYMYNGSSNRYPVYGVELNRKTMQPAGTRREMYFLESWRYGWQRFGEYYDDTFLDPFIEGAWMTEHNGKYYLQYGAPGTEFSGYADGVVVGDDPLGYFSPQSMPFSCKPGGFARGAGHGATYQDNWNNYWHTATIAISVKNNFERRIGIWPAGFDNDGVMYCNQAFGDYPTYLPHDYIELDKPVWTRYLKMENLHMPTGRFALSGFRVFGKGPGEALPPVAGFTVLRTEKDKRNAWIKWNRADDAYAYNIYIGTDPEKLYNCIMVYNANEYWLKTMDREKPYYFAIEAINENGVGERSSVIKQ